MPNAPKKNTAYRLYIMACLVKMRAGGYGVFTVHDFAAFAGLKVTGNLYRQLRSFIDTGDLELTKHPDAWGFKGNFYKFAIDPAMEGK